MKVYRAYKAWFDEHTHIGLFEYQEDAWIACYRYYQENLYYELCFCKGLDYCLCKTHRLSSTRYTRLYIKEEEIIKKTEKWL